MSALVYVVIALASYRIARVFTVDTITVAWRESVYAFAWDDENGEVHQGVLTPRERAPWRTYVYELLTCPVCLGVWISAGVYSIWRWWGNDATHAVIAVFAVAGLQCFLATREGA